MTLKESKTKKFKTKKNFKSETWNYKFIKKKLVNEIRMIWNFMKCSIETCNIQYV